MKKIIILTSLLFLTTLLAAVFYFSNLSVKTRSNDKILAHIPAETALIFQFRNDKSFSEIFKDYEPFNAVLGKYRVAEIIQIKALLLNQTQLSEASDNQNVFVSFYPNKTDSIDLLWTISINNKISVDDIYQSLLLPSEYLTVKEISILKQNVLGITIKSLNKVFYVYLDQGLITGSFSKFLIEKALDKSAPKLGKEFIAEINTSNKKNEDSPFNIFINHTTAFSFAEKFLRNRQPGDFTFLKELKGSSVLNMNFKSDALMFNGISKTDTTSANYLNLFLNQTPVPVNIKNIFPANTSNYIAFGFSDYQKFYPRLRQLLQKRNELPGLNAQINRLKVKYSINLDNEMARIRINELAILQLLSNAKLAVISVNDGSRIRVLLESLSSVSSGDIRRFNDSNILYYYFGDPLKPYARPYFSVIDNYIVIANDAVSVQKFLDDYNADNLLSKTTDFIEFNRLITAESNIQFFIHNKNSVNVLNNSLKRNYARAFIGENAGYKDFYGLSYQWSADKDHFFININASYISPQANKLNLVWKYQLKGRLSMVPQVITGLNNKKLILVQDNINNLFILSEDGKKQWSIQLPEKIEGEVYQLKDNTLLFNTQHNLYRLDISGNIYKGFPVKLLKPASYGLTINDNDPGKLKIFIPCSDQIAVFDALGSVSTGWDKILDGKILFDLKTANLNNTNYLIAGTETGQFYFFNQNGNLAGKAEDISNNKFRNPLALEIKTSINDSKIVTADTAGIVKNIFFNGKIVNKNIGVWSGEHFFDVRNISGDIGPELIYLDKNQLYVYNSDNTLLYNYSFGNSIINRPQFFQLNQSDYQIGISSAQDDLLYLFADDGSIARGFPVKGLPRFYVGNFINNGFKYLIYGDKDNFLHVYKLE